MSAIGGKADLEPSPALPCGRAMSDLNSNFVDPDRVRRYIEQGPPAFAPGHGGMLQMVGVLLGESVADDGQLLVVGAGGGLETRYLAGVEPGWRFVGVDPAPAMLELAREVAGPIAGDRIILIEGTVEDAPPGPFDAATCILVLGLIADDGSKLALLQEARRRLRPGAPFILVDQCIDRSAPDLERRLERYANYALRSGVDAETVAGAKKAVGALESMVPDWRDEELLREAGFRDVELFYAAMAWRGWIAHA
jgi:tRNA (cmo5U34)-methyltransferase